MFCVCRTARDSSLLQIASLPASAKACKSFISSGSGSSFAKCSSFAGYHVPDAVKREYKREICRSGSDVVQH